MGRAEQTARARPSGETLRLFVAAELPEAAKEALAALVRALRELRIDGMRPSLEGLHPVRAEGIHLTLKFLGDTHADRVPLIADALTGAARSASTADVEIRGVGGFPDLEAPQVLWVGLAGDLRPLESLHRAVQAALAPLGHPPDRRPLTPHLTLARLREGASAAQRRLAGEALRRLSWPQGVPAPITAVDLVQSTLLPEGAEYRTLHRAPLGGAPSESDAG